MNTIDYTQKKYNILKIMHKYSHADYRRVNNRMPELLNISPSLWRKWIYLDIEDPYQIPFSYLEQLSKLMSVPVDKLVNYESSEHLEPLPIEKPKAVQLNIFQLGA